MKKRRIATKAALGWLGLVALTALAAGYLPHPYLPGVPDLRNLAVPPLGPDRHYLGTDA